MIDKPLKKSRIISQEQVMQASTKKATIKPAKTIDYEKTAVVQNTPHTSPDHQSMPKRKKSWFMTGMGALLLIAVAVQTQAWVSAAFSVHLVFGALLSALIGLTLISGGRLLWAEWQVVRTLNQYQTMRCHSKQTSTLSEQDIHTFSQQLKLAYPQHSEILQALSYAKEHSLTPSEWLDYMDKVAFKHLDETAKNIITRHSIEASIMLALSPLALLDMALILWRTIKMVSQVADVYGVRPSVWGRWRLFRQVLKTMALAGASELAIDVSQQVVSHSILSKLSTRLAQGMGMGIMLARIGFQTMQLCRPIHFSEQQKPRLSDVRNRLLTEMRKMNSSLDTQLNSEFVEQEQNQPRK